MSIFLTILAILGSILAFLILGVILIVHKIDKIYDELEQLTDLEDEDEGV